MKLPRAIIICLYGLLLLSSHALAAPVTVTKTFSFADLQGMCRDTNIDVTSEGGAVSLTPFELICDSSGHTETGQFSDRLSDRVWAKKEFVLDDPQIGWAELYFQFASDKAKITVNGRPLTIGDPKQWAYNGWATVDVPKEYLRKGRNEVIFSGDVTLYVDNCLQPNQSARSVDGGKTWDYDHLGSNGGYNGEYNVRLGLGRYPMKGILWSEGIDLAALAGTGPIAPAAVPQAVLLAPDASTPVPSALRLQLRSGTTPAYDPERWNAWQQVNAGAWTTLPARHRYLQWRAVLATEHHLVTPLLRSVTLKAKLGGVAAPDPAVTVTRFDNQQIIRNSYNFVYQRPSPKLELLRKKYGLDEVVAGAQSELERFTTLRAWTRHQWDNGWTPGEYHWCLPYNALVILDMAKQGKGVACCGHYATVFIQSAMSLGCTGRVVSGRAHGYAEVWSNEFRKWMLMDVGPAVDDEKELNYHYEVEGVPQSALEMHLRWLKKDWTGVDVAPNRPENDWEPAMDPQAMGRYEYVAVPFRNNKLDSVLPGELNDDGWPSDIDWLYWRDGARQFLHPEMPYTTNRPGDMYWTLNQVAIYPSFSKTAGTLRLDFDTVTPNFARYEVQIDGGAWQACSSTYDWPLHDGGNTLAARTVNAFGKPGIVSTLEVNYAK